MLKSYFFGILDVIVKICYDIIFQTSEYNPCAFQCDKIECDVYVSGCGPGSAFTYDWLLLHVYIHEIKHKNKDKMMIFNYFEALTDNSVG